MIISPRILTQPPHIYSSSQSFAISTKNPINCCALLPVKPSRPSSLLPMASSAAATTVVPEDIADLLGEVSIFTAAGEPVKFKELWDQQEGVAVVALLRHFGCFCSWELALALKESKEKFESAGVKLIAVGIGTPDKAQLFAEKLPFPLDTLYCDPDRKAYEILGLFYGLRRTLLSIASAKAFARYLKKPVKNYTLKATPDDKSGVYQQGGMFVFKGKQLLYARKDEGSGDHAPLDDIFNIVSPSVVS